MSNEMNGKKFPIGTRVGRVYDDESQAWAKYGIVVDPSKASGSRPFGSVAVEWDNLYVPTDNKEIKFDKVINLMLEPDAKKKISELEQEFERVQAEVKSKIGQAAFYLDEAEKIASANGKTVRDMYEAYEPLFKSMNKIGWSTSSLSC